MSGPVTWQDRAPGCKGHPGADHLTYCRTWCIDRLQDRPAQAPAVPPAFAVLTVGQLKAALADVPDAVRVRVEYALDDDPTTCDEQVATGAQLSPTLWYADTRQHEAPRSTADAWFTIAAEFPPDDYARGPR